MKAVAYKRYGAPTVLELVDIEKPNPKAHELLVRVQSTTVTAGDVRLRSLNFPPVARLLVRLIFGFFRPKKQILGHELSGIVEEVGRDVTKFKVGDAIIATTTSSRSGSYAEYVCIPEDRKKGVLAIKPASLSFNQAAALPIGAITALYLLEKAKIGEGMDVLIYGASGSVGSYALQIAKAKGAAVVAVSSSNNKDLMSELGANAVVSYDIENYTSIQKKFDIVMDAVGKVSKAEIKGLLNKNGKFVSVKSFTKPDQSHLNAIIKLVEQSKLSPLIDSCYTLEQIVEAHEYVDKGKKRGNVVIEVSKQN
ncbi:MAG: NAD(P)-dependent alcohol dehydrogenase [Flavobacteriales bacterium]|nr:NAD(P)-dependent alcohol dehydrogenase [Flavobacteriales bacterium]|tara:strand:- start:1031 stop:1957 length:927 start_codon:yes stop_codon:yes gene_type:complete